MPRTGIVVLICLMGVVAYGAVSKAAPSSKVGETAITELADTGKSDANFAIIF